MDTLVEAWRAGQLSRREFLRRTSVLGVSATGSGVVLEHNPWVVVIQPYEDYGFQRYAEFTPNPNQQFEIRRFNLRMKPA